MNTSRLKTLAKYLDTVPEETFNLNHWSCGTQACAIGHACSIPSFRKLGLRLSKGIPGQVHHTPFPVFKDANSWRAVNKFFGLTFDQSGHLFGAQSYEVGKGTAKNVAARIRRLSSSHKAALASVKARQARWIAAAPVLCSDDGWW